MPDALNFQITRAALMHTCPECDGNGRMMRPGHHSMDPYGRTMECDYCAGVGEMVTGCDGFGCGNNAVIEIEGLACCIECEPAILMEIDFDAAFKAAHPGYPEMLTGLSRIVETYKQQDFEADETKQREAV